MSTPRNLWFFIVAMIFTYFLMDIVDIGTKKLSVASDVRHTTQTAMMRSVEEGGIRTKHVPRIDVGQFKSEFYNYGELNAGSDAMDSSYTSIYKVERLTPYAATQIAKPAESKSMKFLDIDEDIWHYPRHRVVYIWDEKESK